MRERAGRGSSAPLLVLYVAPNDVGATRFGITVSGRVGKAVVRNRARRRIREAMRERLGGLRSGVDLVVVARPAIVHASFAQIGAALDMVLRRAEVLVPPATEPARACV